MGRYLRQGQEIVETAADQSRGNLAMPIQATAETNKPERAHEASGQWMASCVASPGTVRTLLCAYGISANGSICKSATITLPLVSGLKNRVMTKLVKPPTVPISIGTANPMCCSTAK